MIPNKKFTESVNLSYETADLGRLEESFGDDLPPVVFPEMHAITANWVTRNYTYYPTKSLKGDANAGTGLVSWYYPFPTPILRDHNTGGGFFGGDGCVPYGRVYHSSFVSTKAGGGWLRLVPAITDPFAIEMILTRRFLTLSIGSETDELYCSICKATLGKKAPNMLQDGICDHYRGEHYPEGLCYWEIGPVRGRETSFVNVPADVNARVVTPSLDADEARKLFAGTDGAALIDLATGARESAGAGRNLLGVSGQMYSSILSRAMAVRKAYEYVVGEPPRFGNLPEDEDKIREFYRLTKGT